MTYDDGEDVLWIEIHAVTNNLAYLSIHNVESNWFGQLLMKPSLSDATWAYGPVTAQNTNGTNQLFFDPIPTGGKPTQFFRGVEGATRLRVFYGADATEPSALTNNNGVYGNLLFYSDPILEDDLVVKFQIAGAAMNGVDYTQIVDHVTLPGGFGEALALIKPVADNLLEFDENVVLSLLLTNGYVVEPENSWAQTFIVDYLGTNIIFTTVTNLNSPVGLDYSPTTNALIASVNLDLFGQSALFNFERLGSNGSGLLVTNQWSGVSDLDDEVKIAIVKTNAGGFTNGDMYFSSGTGIGWLSANGTTSDLNWATLTNDVVTNALPIRGSLYVDQAGLFSNQLIAVTSGDDYTLSDKGVWLVDSTRQTRLLTQINTRHLEGVTTLPVTTNWGPWSGKLLTGDEDARDETLPDLRRPLIYAIDTNGIVETAALDIQPEDFEIIPTNQDLYCTLSGGNGSLQKVSRTLLSPYVGALAITQAGEFNPNGRFPSAVFVANWDATNSVFNLRRITYGNDQGFEHSTFAPLSLPSY